MRWLKEQRAQLSKEQQKALSKAMWVERWLSLWAPVTVFGLFFLVYLVIVESSVCTYLVLQPIQKIIGLICFIAWAGLVVARNAWGPFKKMRAARHQAEEQLNEVAGLLQRRGVEVQPKAREELAELTRALMAAYPGEPKGTEDATAKLATASDKHLSKWRRGGAFDFIGGFGKALLIALAIRTVFLEPFKIPSGSMVPTLEIGDQIFVNKFIYGVRIPFTNFVPFQIVRAPKRGDVIVFNNPVETDKDFIKRVIGIPGDKIQIKGHELWLNGVLQPVSDELDDYYYWDDNQGAAPWHQNPAVLKREVLDGQTHQVLYQPVPNEFDADQVIEVPEKSVFVMGDNRDNSEDSRYGLGARSRGVQFVPYGSIKGKATVIWLSLSYGGLFSGIPFFKGTGLRTDRLFLPVTMCGNEPLRTTP